jgi:hypothetical protein
MIIVAITSINVFASTVVAAILNIKFSLDL